MRLVEQLGAQIGGPDRVRLVNDELSPGLISIEDHSEAECHQEAEQTQHAAEQVSLLRNRLARLVVFASRPFGLPAPKQLAGPCCNCHRRESCNADKQYGETGEVR